MYFRETSKNGIDFHYPNCEECLLAFSRVLHNGEILVVYNSSPKDSKEEHITIDKVINSANTYLKCIHGRKTKIKIQNNKCGQDDRLFIKLKLSPMEFLIFKNK